jgi:cytochrome P450
MTDPFYNETIPPGVSADQVFDFNLFAPCFGDLDPFESVSRLHGLGLPPIFWTRNNGGHWIALAADAIDDVVGDPHSFSSMDPFVPPEHNFGGPPFVPLNVDPPEHAGYRAIVAPIFAPARLGDIEAEVRRMAGEWIDQASSAGTCEFMYDFAARVPVGIFLKLLDLPAEDLDDLLKIGRAFASPPPPDAPRDAVIQTLFDYLRPIVEDRAASPRDDVISKVTVAEYQDRRLTIDEMVGMCATIVSAGIDTTSAALGFIFEFLARSTEHRRALVADPSLISAATEELVRRFGATSLARRAVATVVVHGAPIRPEQRILWMTSMYNLNPARFERPMEVEFTRPRSVHMSFGKGIHSCLGARLARIELGVFLKEWLARIPDFEVLDGKTPFIRPGLSMSYDSLPLVW